MSLRFATLIASIYYTFSGAFAEQVDDASVFVQLTQRRASDDETEKDAPRALIIEDDEEAPEEDAEAIQSTAVPENPALRTMAELDTDEFSDEKMHAARMAIGATTSPNPEKEDEALKLGMELERKAVEEERRKAMGPQEELEELAKENQELREQLDKKQSAELRSTSTATRASEDEVAALRTRLAMANNGKESMPLSETESEDIHDIEKNSEKSTEGLDEDTLRIMELQREIDELKKHRADRKTEVAKALHQGPASDDEEGTSEEAALEEVRALRTRLAMARNGPESLPLSTEERAGINDIQKKVDELKGQLWEEGAAEGAPVADEPEQDSVDKYTEGFDEAPSARQNMEGIPEYTGARMLWDRLKKERPQWKEAGKVKIRMFWARSGLSCGQALASARCACTKDGKSCPSLFSELQEVAANLNAFSGATLNESFGVRPNDNDASHACQVELNHPDLHPSGRELLGLNDLYRDPELTRCGKVHARMAGEIFMNWLRDEEIPLSFVGSSMLMRSIETAEAMFMMPCRRAGKKCAHLMPEKQKGTMPVPFLGVDDSSNENLPTQLGKQTERLRKELTNRNISLETEYAGWPEGTEFEKFKVLLATVVLPKLGGEETGLKDSNVLSALQARPKQSYAQKPIQLSFDDGEYYTGPGFSAEEYEKLDAPEINIAMAGHADQIIKHCLDGQSVPYPHNNEVFEKRFLLESYGGAVRMSEQLGKCAKVLQAKSLNNAKLTSLLAEKDLSTCTSSFQASEAIMTNMQGSTKVHGQEVTQCVAEGMNDAFQITYGKKSPQPRFAQLDDQLHREMVQMTTTPMPEVKAPLDEADTAPEQPQDLAGEDVPGDDEEEIVEEEEEDLEGESPPVSLAQVDSKRTGMFPDKVEDEEHVPIKTLKDLEEGFSRVDKRNWKGLHQKRVDVAKATVKDAKKLKERLATTTTAPDFEQDVRFTPGVNWATTSEDPAAQDRIADEFRTQKKQDLDSEVTTSVYNVHNSDIFAKNAFSRLEDFTSDAEADSPMVKDWDGESKTEDLSVMAWNSQWKTRSSNCVPAQMHIPRSLMGKLAEYFQENPTVCYTCSRQTPCKRTGGVIHHWDDGKREGEKHSFKAQCLGGAWNMGIPRTADQHGSFGPNDMPTWEGVVKDADLRFCGMQENHESVMEWSLCARSAEGHALPCDIGPDGFARIEGYSWQDIADNVKDARITLAGVIRMTIKDTALGFELYSAIVQPNKVAIWPVRGPKVFKMITDQSPDVLMLNEYDFHTALAKYGGGDKMRTFVSAMSDEGYGSEMIWRPGRKGLGWGYYYKKSKLTILGKRTFLRMLSPDSQNQFASNCPYTSAVGVLLQSKTTGVTFWAMQFSLSGNRYDDELRSCKRKQFESFQKMLASLKTKRPIVTFGQHNTGFDDYYKVFPDVFYEAPKTTGGSFHSEKNRISFDQAELIRMQTARDGGLCTSMRGASSEFLENMYLSSRSECDMDQASSVAFWHEREIIAQPERAADFVSEENFGREAVDLIKAKEAAGIQMAEATPSAKAFKRHQNVKEICKDPEVQLPSEQNPSDHFPLWGTIKMTRCRRA